MHYNASLRIRELTQNIYDIGDEIAEHIEHVAQACQDWDAELVEDCLHELKAVVAQGRKEVRPGLTELNGLRQAFVSGVRGGEMSNTFHHPGRTLSFLRKSGPTPPEEASGKRGAGLASGKTEEQQHGAQLATTAGWRLRLRQGNEEILSQLNALAEWVVEQTDLALNAQAVLLPQAYSQAETHTKELVGKWRELIEQQPALVRGMRGEAPPPFLEERDRIERLVHRLSHRKGRVV